MSQLQDPTLVGEIEDPYVEPSVPSEKRVGDAFAASILSPEADADAVYSQIESQYSFGGNSPTVESVRDMQGTAESATRAQVIQELALNPDSTPEEIEYNARAAVTLDQSPTDLMMSLGARGAEIDDSATVNEFWREDGRVSSVYSRVDQLRAKAYLLQREVYTEEEEREGASINHTAIGAAGGAMVDFAGAMLPFNEAKAVYAVAREIGLNPSAVDFVRYGELKRKIIRHVKSKVGADRDVVIATAKIALQKHSGFFGDNHFLRKTLADEFTSSMDDKAWWHFVDNVVGVIDVLGVTKLGINTVKAVSKSALHTVSNADTAIRAKVAIAKGSPISVLKTSNPRVAVKAAVEAISDTTGKIASKLGTTREELIEEFTLPTPVPHGSKIDVYEGMPANVLAKVLSFRTGLADAYTRTTSNITRILTKEEVDAAKDTVLTRFGKFFNSQENIPTSRLEISPDGDKMRLTAQFQADEYGGYKSMQDLFDSVRAQKGSQSVEDITVWHRAPDSDDYIDVTNDLPEMWARSEAGDIGDVTYSVKIDIPVSSEWKLALPDNAVTAGLGWWGKHIAGQQMFNKQIRSDFSVAVDRVGFFDRAVGDTIKEAFKNVGGKGVNLFKKNKDYDSVITTLRQGAKEEKWYTPKELLKKGFTEDQMTAYYGYKEASDILYRATARDMWKTLNKEGMNTIRFGPDVDDMVGRGLSLEEAQGMSGMFKGEPIQAYNPITGKTTAIGSPEKVAALYGQGKRIATPRGGKELGTYTKDGKSYYNYVIVDEARGASVGKLSSFPTPYTEGHYFRAYKDDNYIVRYTSTDSTLNGVKEHTVTKALGVVRNKHEANLFIRDEMNRLGTKLEDYKETAPGSKWHEGRMQTEDDWELIKAASLKSNRARKEHLRSLDDNLAPTEGPVESMGRSISAVANRIGKRDQIEANQAAWQKTYGTLLGTHGWPSNRQALKDVLDNKVSTGKMSNRQGKEAIAYYDYIEMNRGIGAPISTIWSNWVFRTLNATDSKLAHSISPTMAHGVGLIDPALRMKQSAFLLFIALAPFRQLILQPTQITNMVALFPKYMTTRFVVDLSAVTAEAIFKGAGGPRGAQLWKEINASAILKNVDHHQWINQSQTARVLTGDELRPFSWRNSAYKLLKIPQKIGFEAGEKMNQVMHWLAARDEYKLANPNLTDADMLKSVHSDAILARHRDLSGSMNPAGKLGYQGWGRWQGEVLSAQMQFMSHSHKMLQMMSPQLIGGAKFLTPKQKLQLATGNVVLWGAALIPFMNKMINEVQDTFPELEMSEDMNKGIQLGLADVMINKGLGVVWGDNPNLQISASFNPTGGVESFMTNFYETVTNDPVTEWDTAAGIGAMGRMFEAASAISTIWKTPEEIYGDESKILGIIQEMGNVTSGMSNYGKAVHIIEAGKTASRSGDEIAEANLLEAGAKMLGITLGSEKAYYDLIAVANEQRETYQDIQNDVRVIHTNVNKMLADRDDLTPIQKEVILNTHLAMRFTKMSSKEVAYKEIVKLRNRNYLDGLDSISLKVMENAMRSGDLDALKTYIRTHPDTNPAIINFYDALLSNRGTE